MRIFLLALALLAFPFTASSAAPPTPGLVHVKVFTTAGVFILALDQRHASKTTANFMRYVDDGRLDGTSFYRAARRKGAAKLGFIQGGIGSDVRRTLSPVPLEPTSQTGIRHLDATISMAHGDNANSGNANFSILVGANPALDAHGRDRGFAAFGRVVAGMDTVKRILALPTGGGSGPMKGQMLLRPVKILRAQRIDGVARPTGGPKPWLINIRR